MVSGCSLGLLSGDIAESAGIWISYNASVGQEPIQDKQPTQVSSLTITGLLLNPSGQIASGSKASNGQ